MNNQIGDEHMDYLCEALLALQTKEECYKLLTDLCTIAELKAMTQRMQVAKMLTEQQVYADIVRKTGASTATISRVNRCLSYGEGGYKLVIARTRGEE